MNGKRVLITGGSGFIGSHLVQRLLADGSEVAVLMRYGNVIKNERLNECWSKIQVIEADIRNRGALTCIRQFDPHIVFHLAAYNHVGESFRQVEECFDVNAKGTANLLDACEGAEKFVYVSSSEVYGHQGQVPFLETACPNPISPYSITKYAGELYCRMKQRMSTGQSIVILRLFNAYGPYQSTKAIIPEVIVNCLLNRPLNTTPGKQTREFNYIDNLLDGLIAAARHKGKLDEIINICSGEEVSIADLIEKIKKITKTKSVHDTSAPYRPNELWRLCGSNQKAKEILGWTPRIHLEEGLRRTVDWFQEYFKSHPALG